MLDLNLGSVSGFDVLEWLRAQPQFQGLPVVIFSSSNNSLDKQKALSLGANDYIPKPQSGVDFHEAIATFERRWLGNGTGLPAGDAQPSAPPLAAKPPWAL